MVISFINKTAKYLVILILLGSFIFGMYWLWQRQPRPKLTEVKEVLNIPNEKQKEDEQLSPQNQKVLNSPKVSFKGKSQAESLVIFYSNDFQAITKTKSDGTFETKEMPLTTGLNLIQMATVADEKVQTQRSLTYFVDENDKNSQTVWTGAVKSTLESLITINAQGEELNIRTSKNTVFDLPPKDESAQTATVSAARAIRVGDYLVALGNLPEGDNQPKANRIQVFREDIPKNTRVLTIAKITTSPKLNKLSAKIISDNSLLELTTSRDTQTQMDGETIQLKDVVKDKNAIIIYHPEAGKKIADLIYLLSQ